MGSAGLVEENDQYATTLPEDLWSPDGFPSWGYKDELAKTQREVARRHESERKGAEREFVPATRENIRVGETGGKKASAAERVMAGLERRGPRETERSPKRRRRSKSR